MSSVRLRRLQADYHKVLDIEALHALAGCGRPGSVKLRAALERHDPKLARTRSPLERVFLPLCEKYGVPLPDDVNVLVAGVLVDAVWWRQKLVVELDGKDNHSSWGQIQRDRSNEMRLRAAGFDALRVLLCGTHKGARRIVRIYHHNNSCMIIDPRGIDLPAPMELHRKGTQGDRLQGAQMLEQGIRRRRDCDRVAGIA